MPYDLSGQQHFQNFGITLQLRMEMMGGVQSRHDPKAKPPVGIQQVLHERVTRQLRANVCKDHSKLLAHLRLSNYRIESGLLLCRL